MTPRVRTVLLVGASLCAQACSGGTLGGASSDAGATSDAGIVRDAAPSFDAEAIDATPIDATPIDAHAPDDSGSFVDVPALPDLGGPVDGGIAPLLAELIVIHGESNAAGTAQNSEAPAAERLPRASVQILNNDTFLFEDLLVGTNNNIDQSVSAEHEHGLELGLAHEVEAGHFGSAPVYLVKCGRSGSRISQWMPESGWGFWEECLERTDAAIALLASAGIEHRITVWQSIGLNDYYSSEYYPTHDTSWMLWKPLMLEWRSLFRARYGADIPILSTEFNASMFGWNFVLEDIASEDPPSRAISEEGTAYREPYWHWNYAGFMELASRFVAETLELRAP